jgi:AcrR family transcriptional regulator
VAVPDLAGGRVERVLDVAAELLVRWGYQRVTIDEVARHAGIGKGTVYLHFRTKDALFLTVLLRAERGIAEHMAQRAEDDPRYVLPSRLTGGLYRELSDDPVLRGLFMADVEVLGRLIHEAAETIGELAARRDRVLDEHFRLLQEAGCLRADLSRPALLYTFSAVGSGFFFLSGIPGTDGVAGRVGVPNLAVEERIELLERAIAAAVEVPEPPAAELAHLAPTVAGLYRSLTEHIDNEWRRRVR